MEIVTCGKFRKEMKIDRLSKIKIKIYGKIKNFHIIYD